MSNVKAYVVAWLKLNWAKMLIGIVIGCLLGHLVFGADLTATWTNPVQNTDDTAIPANGAGSLSSNRVEYGSCAGAAFGTKAGEVVTPTAVTTTTITNLAPGTYCARVYAKNTYGSESIASNVASKTVAVPTPKPPTLATIATVAYDVKFDLRRLRFALNREVGEVPLGVGCDKSFRIGEYYAVPRKSVDFSRRTSSAVIVAKCG